MNGWFVFMILIKTWNNFILFNVHGSLYIMKKQSANQSMFAGSTNSYYKHEMNEHF